MRFQLRHVQQTLADYIETGLTGLGWVNEPRNFGGAPLEFRDVEPDVDEAITGRIVATVLPDVGPNEAFELGGGLRQIIYDLHVHVRTEQQSVTNSVCQDVVDLLTDRQTDMVDYTGVPTSVQGAYIEFETVVIDRPFVLRTVEFRRPWRVVTALAHLYKLPS